MRISSLTQFLEKLSPAPLVIMILVATAFSVPLVGYAQDPYPSQFIAFFNAKECPGGWTPTGNTLDRVTGRFLVPVMPNGTTQDQVETALASGENRTHTHSFSSSITLPSTYIYGADGCCDDSQTSEGNYTFGGTTAASTSEVPYVQLLVCMKSNEPPGSGDIPTGVLMFTAGLDCPSGWTQPAATQGRFMVGLPAGGSPFATFGGDPLAPHENRTHAHSFSGSFTPGSKSLIQFMIWKAWGYGHSGTQNYSGVSGTASTGLPYMQILQCEKS
ncbi:hypothetical protein [Candidatus Nitrospira neomarina]|uniref:Phage tail collar domain-containing protein n=1 Tax=Candidatus Nitrospira neomarina TaxID=3020899 RepID=A0AA96GFG9_9BACT|nr:hypothetical protein [Candidatus Nitrospira neomarina]WNM61344.1 hypothetical protein PQG83_16525 [Candidatus Nitrospira neomarina]